MATRMKREGEKVGGSCGLSEAFGFDSEQPEGHCGSYVDRDFHRGHSSRCAGNRLPGMRIGAGDLSGGFRNHQVRGDGSLGRGSSGRSEKWSDSGFISKTEPTGFPDNW